MTETMKSWFRTATATFLGGAAAIGLVAIPTYVWLPREFDKLHTAADAAKIASDAAAESSLATKDAVERLVAATARTTAEPLGVDREAKTFMASADAEAVAKFRLIVSSDVFAAMEETNALAGTYYSGFDGRDWVFIDQGAFSSLPGDIQKSLFEGLERNNAEFFLEGKGLRMSPMFSPN